MKRCAAAETFGQLIRGLAVVGLATLFDCRDAEAAGATGRPWTIEVIDPQARSSNQPDVTVDAQGVPHVAYAVYFGDVLSGRTEIRHAWRPSTEWLVETVAVASEQFPGDRVRIVIDNQQRPHIAYHQLQGGSAGIVTHALLENGAWQLRRVNPPTINARDPDLVVDSRGRPQLVMNDNNQPAFLGYHAVLFGDTWVVNPVTTFSAKLPALAIGRNDQLHVAGNQSGEAGYFTNPRGVWDREFFDAAPGDSSAIALNSLDQPSIAYYDSRSQSVRLQSLTSQGWTHETLFQQALQNPMGLAFTPADQPRVAFLNQANGQFVLHVASRSSNGWSVETVDAHDANSPPFGTSLAVSSRGEEFVIFGNTGRGLMVGSRVPEPAAATLGVVSLAGCGHMVRVRRRGRLMPYTQRALKGV